MVGVRHRSYPAKTNMAPHMHPHGHFNITVDGGYEETILERAREHRPGGMFFYPGGEVHSQCFGSSGLSALIFVPTATSLDFLADRHVNLRDAHYVHDPVILLLARRILREQYHPDQFSELVVGGLLLETIATFGRAGESQTRASQVPPWLLRVKHSLDEEPAKSITHELLAKQSGKHPVHLARAFRKEFGETVGGYQRRLRLQQAAELLLEGDTPLVEVALRCGFSSHSHFCRSFKRIHGLTPSEFRAKRT